MTENGDEISVMDDERLLKHVTATDDRHLRPSEYDIWACIGKDGYITIRWNRVGASRSMTSSEWLKPVKGSDKYFSSMSNWDELNWALSCLGVKKEKVKSYKVDEFGDTKEFFCSYYDLSPIL